MEVHVGEMTSTVRVTDSLASLSAPVLEQIVRAVLDRLRQEQQHERRASAERQLWPAASAREAPSWE